MVTIGITDCGKKFDKYKQWIYSKDDRITVIKLSWKENNLAEVNKCDGIVLTGGEDVHPRLYGKPEYLSLLDTNDINIRRDEFELKVIEKTIQQQKPLLGICRGLQIANVYFQGTLIPDIPGKGLPSHSKINENDRIHSVKLETNTLLKEVIGIQQGMVNSAHHQAADKIGKGLKASAWSEEGIVEGLEWDDQQSSFLLLVQWHPERMNDSLSPFSKNIREKFINQLFNP